MIKPYDKYRQTKNIWYSEVPSHWLLSKIKYVAKTLAGGTPSTDKSEYWDNGDIPWLPSGKLQNCDITTAEKFITEEGLNNSSTKWIKPNTTLIALTGATCANIGFLKFKACANQSVVAIDEFAHKVNSRFLFYMLISMRKQILTHQSGGAQAGINDGDVRNLILAVPPLYEQLKIAQYLDHQTSIIDQLIQQKEKLIELLKEKRMAVINEAVTKGLNPNFKMKDSGIEWLGEVPVQWQIKKLKYLLEHCVNPLKTGPFGSQLKASDTIENGEFVVYNQRNVLDNQFSEFKDKVSKEKFDSLAGFEVLENDILITTRGTIGKAALVSNLTSRGILHPCLIKVRVNRDEILREWLLMYINNSSYFLENVKLESNSTTIEVIYGGTLSNVIIPVPPIENQRRILSELEEIEEKYSDLIQGNLNAITLLKEYRHSIISEAVTGKIDVRNWQSNK